MSKVPQQPQPQPRVDVAKSEDGDLIRQSSLLPGEVRTPTMVVTLSEAWGDVSGDWAAPGSSVWDEEAPSRHSAHTPLMGYGVEGDVWASATGSPLLGAEDADGNANAFEAAAAGQYHPTSAAGGGGGVGQPDPAALAAAALEALTPHTAALHADPQLLHGAPPHMAMPMHAPQRGGLQQNAPRMSMQPQQQRFMGDARDTYEGRFGTVHAAPSSDPIRGMRGVVPFHSPMHQYRQPQHVPQQQQQQPQEQSYFTVQEGGSRGRPAPFSSSPMAARNYGIPVLSTNVNQGIGSAGGAGMAGFYSNQGSPNVPFVPRLDDEEVSHSIIASAGLPLSMRSLVDYIHDGQPHTLSYVSALGSTQNALRNYPNLNEPPTEEDAMHGGNAGARGGRVPQPSYMQQQPQQQQQQGRWSQPSATPENTGFAVRGSDYSGGNSQHTPTPPPTFYANNNNGRGGDGGDAGGGGGFVVSAGNGPTHTRSQPTRPSFGGGVSGGGTQLHGGAAGRHKSESEYLSDLLHFHANFFPPPPPPRVPKDERRNRAELWYHYASKWDITHRLPPPPRTPLPEMALEYRMRLQRMTRVPYHGDGWLQMAEQWFDVTQTLFDFPEENVGEEVDFNVVLEQAVLS